MASEHNVKVIISAENKTGPAINSTQTSLESLTASVKRFAAAAGIAFATKKVIDFGVASVRAFSEAEAAQERMAHILRFGVTKATEEQIDMLQKQADALERVGVVSKEAILVGQGQLASFDLQAESIQKLIPAILNYAVAERGANLSGEELKSVTNGLAQALNGNFASLTKTGFVLDEATKALIENGTETERVAALVKVLDSTYSGLNEKMRETTEGQIVGLQFAMDNLKESVGAALVEGLTPLIQKLTQLAENPDFINAIVLLANVIGKTLLVAIQAVTVAWNTMVDGWLAAFAVFDEIKSKVDAVVNALNSVISLASRAASAVSGAVSGAAGRITGRRAEGGPVQGGSAFLVGERGPELFRPKVSGDIIPNTRLAGAGGVVINITGNTLLDDLAGEKIADQIMRAVKSNIRV